MRQILQREAAERQRHAAADAMATHVDQLERTAAEIADDAVRIVHAGHDAERRQLGFTRTGEDFDPGAANLLRLGDEVRTVLGVAAGGRRNRIDAADLLNPAQRAKAPQRGQGLVDGVIRQQAGGLDLAAQSAQRLFVEDGDKAARHRRVHDEAHRVRTDVDDSDAGSALPRSLHRGNPLWRRLTFVAACEAARRRFLERLSTA